MRCCCGYRTGDPGLSNRDRPVSQTSAIGKNNALAHYHLGFAYGMTGNVSKEISEYRTAIGLGLKVWDLFLNLGLAYYDQHDLQWRNGSFGDSRIIRSGARRDSF